MLLSRRGHPLVFMMVVLFLTAGILQAAMIPQTTVQLTVNSSHILRGEVLSVQAMWDESETTIYTKVVVSPAVTFKESTSTTARITILVPGGEVDGIKLWVEHTPEFAVGQDVILFLVDKGSYFDITSWVQGKYTVENEKVIEKDLTESTFVKQIKTAVTEERKANGEE